MARSIGSWLAPRKLARVLSLKLSLFLAGCGAGGIAAIIAGVLLFCTPFGAPLIVAGLAEIYWEFKDDDPNDPNRCCRPPLVDCPPPEHPAPRDNLLVCFLHHQDSQCPAWRFSAKREGSSDRPVWVFDTHASTVTSQHVTADPLRMSYPGGRDWPVPWNGTTYTMSGTSLICSRIYHDLNGDGRGDGWATVPDFYEFEAYYSNGDRVNTSSSVVLGGLGGGVFIDEGTTTLTHGWLPGGAKFYGTTFMPALVMKMGVQTEEFITSDGDVVDLPSVEEACRLTGETDGYWEEIGTSFRFVAVR